MVRHKRQVTSGIKRATLALHADAHIMREQQLRILCPFLFLHIPFYTLQANLFLSEISGSL